MPENEALAWLETDNGPASAAFRLGTEEFPRKVKAK